MLLMGSRYAVLAGLAALLAVPAMAQFEISPDHFDEPRKEAAQRLSPEAQKLQTQITEQKGVLADYQAQIDTRRKELDALWNDIISKSTDDEAGQAIAFFHEQKQFEEFKRSMVPRITAVESNVARLEQKFIALISPTTPPPTSAANQPRTVAARKPHRRTKVLTASGSSANHLAGGAGASSTLH